MKTLVIIFLVSLVAGQAGAITFAPGVVIYAHDLILFVLLIESFVQYAIRGSFVKPKLLVPIIVFCAAAVISLLANSGQFLLDKLGLSALYLVRFVLYASLYIVVVQRFVKMSMWVKGLFTTGVILSLLGFAQFVLYPDLRNLFYLGWDDHYYRLFSTFLDPNFVGLYIVLTILLGIGIAGVSKKKLIMYLFLFVLTIALLLTYSRSSYLALVAGITTYTIVKKKYWFLLGILVFIAASITIPRAGTILDLTRETSALARIGNWQYGLDLFMNAPVFGHGFNTLRYLSSDITAIPSKAAGGLDSSILFVAATMGIVGLIAFANLIKHMIAVGKAATYSASLVAIGVHSLFVNSAFYPWILVWLFILTAATEAQSSGGKRLFE